MIFYALRTLKEAGITNILLVTGTESAGDFMKLLGSGESLGVQITFRVQEKAGGIADALRLAENFAAQENIAVILGDNIFADNVKPDAQKFSSGAKLFVKEVPDPERFGVVTFDTQNTVIGIEEKPEYPKTNFASTGLYFFDPTVFKKILTLSPSPRGEYEIADINQLYIDEKNMQCRILEGQWSDAGTHESLFHASTIAREIQLGK